MGKIIHLLMPRKKPERLIFFFFFFFLDGMNGMDESKEWDTERFAW